MKEKKLKLSVQKHAVLLVNTNPSSQSIQETAVKHLHPSPPHPEAGKRLEQEEVCSNPLQREVRARRIYILTRLTAAP